MSGLVKTAAAKRPAAYDALLKAATVQDEKHEVIPFPGHQMTASGYTVEQERDREFARMHHEAIQTATQPQRRQELLKLLTDAATTNPVAASNLAIATSHINYLKAHGLLNVAVPAHQHQRPKSSLDTQRQQMRQQPKL
jgi:hypothetical protein